MMKNTFIKYPKKINFGPLETHKTTKISRYFGKKYDPDFLIKYKIT